MRVASNRQKIVAIAILFVMASTLILGMFAQLASSAPVSSQSTPAIPTEQIQLAAGENFTCALLNDGTVKCWGDNANGELGRDSTTDVGRVAGDSPNLGN